MLPLLLPGFELATFFNHESGALTNKLSRLPTHNLQTIRQGGLRVTLYMCQLTGKETGKGQCLALFYTL